MNPDSTISAIRPSMIALVSTTMCGSPRRGVAPLGGRRPADEPDRLGRQQQVLAAWRPSGPPSRARGTATRRAAATSRRVAASATAAGRAGGPSAGRAAGRRRPSRTRRSTAPGRARIEPARGHDREVRQDREADDEPGDDPGDQSRRRRRSRRSRRTSRPAGRGEGEPDEAAERGAEQADIADQRVARRPPARRSPARERSGAAVSLASRRVRSPRAGALRRAPPRSRREASDAADGPRPSTIGRAASPAPRRGTIARANPSRAASRSRRSRPAHRPQLAQQADLADRDRPGGTGRSRSDDARASASGRSSAGSSTVRPPARLT